MTSQRQFWRQGCRRISVRGLLFLVAVLCILLGMEASRVHRQQQAIARINELGGLYAYADQFRFSPWMNSPSNPPPWLKRIVGDNWFRKVVLINFDEGSDPTNDDLALLSGLPDVREITLFGRKRITDEGLIHLRKLKHLEKLPLSGTRVRGSGLRHLRAQKLTLITLQDTPFTDEGMVYLANRPNLTYLELSGTKITDKGLSELENLPSLTRLEISRTAISDDGLEHLARLTSLNQLFIGSTNTTAEGRARLQQALPKCKISH